MCAVDVTKVCLRLQCFTTLNKVASLQSNTCGQGHLAGTTVDKTKHLTNSSGNCTNQLTKVTLMLRSDDLVVETPHWKHG